MISDAVLNIMPEVDYNEDDVEISADYPDETVDVKHYTISGYGLDFDVEGLVRRLERGDIEIPEFQRTFVWNQKRASRFVESLLMGLPVPGIFLYRDNDSNTLRVIDGQQRLRSLAFFYKGEFPGLNYDFRLTGLKSRFEGRSYQELLPEDKRRLNDSIIHASIIEQLAPEDDGSSQFALFERLNTTATHLSPQEIRAAIYGGEFNQLLSKLNECVDWRELFGKVHRRKRDQELILRFLALYYEIGEYRPPMKQFLNDHLRSNRDLCRYSESEIREAFESTVKTILSKLGPKAFKPVRAVNAALLDSLMVAIARRLEQGPIHGEIRSEYNTLLTTDRFRDSIFAGTSQSDSVLTRIDLATRAFASVE